MDHRSGQPEIIFHLSCFPVIQLHSGCRSLANGMVVGTSEGFVKDLQLIGVGYRGAVNGNTLTMNLGFSHPVVMTIPHDVEVKVPVTSQSTIINKYASIIAYLSGNGRSLIVEQYCTFSNDLVKYFTRSCMHSGCFVTCAARPVSLRTLGCQNLSCM